ncbi:MAG TPA: hypothetical protein VF122_06795 [Caulobacteraceae bacterium]
MTLTRLLTAAGFAAVLAAGSAAYAQSTDTTVTVDEQGNTTTTTTIDTPGAVDPTVTTSANSAVSVGLPASSMVTTTAGEPGTVTMRTVTNGPVPDTAENRAKYGQPLSRAGKRTAAAGN